MGAIRSIAEHVRGPMLVPFTRANVESALDEHVFDAWFPACVDHRRGGFHAHFAANWRPLNDPVRLLEFQARQTRTAALALPPRPRSLEVGADLPTRIRISSRCHVGLSRRWLVRVV